MGEQLKKASVAHRGDDAPLVVVVGVWGRQEERKRSVPVVSDAGEVRRKGCCVVLVLVEFDES